jgi:hypothetical protein
MMLKLGAGAPGKSQDFSGAKRERKTVPRVAGFKIKIILLKYL